MPPWLEVFARFLRLGLTAFGGPVAHLGYFRREFVERSTWLDDDAYAEITALCSVLPGPTSSQVGMLLGVRRAGALGGFVAWLGFTAPSALVMFGLGCALGPATHPAARAAHADHAGITGVLLGVEGVATAVVLVAVIAMARSLLRSGFARALAPVAFLATLAIDVRAPAFAWVILLAAGIVAARFAPATPLPRGPSALPRGSRTLAILAAGGLGVGLFGLPLIAGRSELLTLFVTFFRAGSLVFGGGHVVLPFLESIVTTGRIDEPRFLLGYGAVQAMPGPLSTFAAYIGAADARAASMPALASLAALLGIFAPSLLLLVAAVPLWGRIRALPRAGNVLSGLNAAVVGILAAVFVDPIALAVARSPIAVSVALGALVLLQFARTPSWAVVLLGAGAGAAASAFGGR